MMFPGTQAMGMSPLCNEMSNLSVYSVVVDTIVGLCGENQPTLVGFIAYRSNDSDTTAQPGLIFGCSLSPQDNL